jgi:Xaa-Pro aminopeptidase
VNARALLLVVALASVATAQDAAPAAPPPSAAKAAASEDAERAEKRDRRARLAKLAGREAAVLVLAADDSPGFTGSTQSRDFEYLSPFDARGAAILLTLDAADDPAVEPRVTDRLYLRPRDPANERWTGAVAGPGDATRDAGLLAEAPPVERLVADLVQSLKARRTLYVSSGGPADRGRLLAPLVAALRTKLAGTWVRLFDVPGTGPEDFAESVRRALPETLPRGKSPDDVLAALPVVDVKNAGTLTAELREVKSADEIARIRAATDATVAGFKDALRAARPGLLEMQLAGIVELRCRLGGCMRQAYPSIVGAGPNSCVLHYSDNTRALADGDLVVMDLGGEYRGYACDVTRTIPANGKFTEEQAQVYDAVLAAQEAGIAVVKPGVTMRQVHTAAAAVLKERGLVQHFPHGTSHSVGLDVHDPFRQDMPLRAGSVLTVEPGVYIAAKALGVRIEDTVLVTETGCEVLSAALPKTRDAIEKLMAEDPPFAVEPPR